MVMRMGASPHPCSCDPDFRFSPPPAGRTASPLCPVCTAAALNAQAPVGAESRRRRKRPLESDEILDRRGAGPQQSKTWAIGNLKGRAGGYRRGTLSLAGVTGAVRVALSWDVSAKEIQAVLDQYELRWDSSAGETLDRRLAMN